MKSLCQHKHESRDREAENKIPNLGNGWNKSYDLSFNHRFRVVPSTFTLKIIQETPEHRSVVTCLTRPEKNDGNGSAEVHLETLGMASILVHKSNTMQTMQ